MYLLSLTYYTVICSLFHGLYGCMGCGCCQPTRANSSICKSVLCNILHFSTEFYLSNLLYFHNAIYRLPAPCSQQDLWGQSIKYTCGIIFSFQSRIVSPPTQWQLCINKDWKYHKKFPVIKRGSENIQPSDQYAAVLSVMCKVCSNGEDREHPPHYVIKLKYSFFVLKKILLHWIC